MKPPLIKQLDLAMSDKSPAVRLACRIVLGLELQHLKQEGGYEGCGTYNAFRDRFKPGERMTWTEYCPAQAGISERTATFYFQCAQAVMVRLRCIRRPGWKDLHRKMEKQPSSLTAAERADMIQKIVILGLTKGETQSQLLREYHGVHLPQPEPEMNYAKIEESGEARHCPYCERANEVTRKVELVRLAMVALREVRRRRALGMEPPCWMPSLDLTK
jgi:hypothetical protein